MGLRINNISSLSATNQLQRTQSAIARSLERLSTGSRVNAARDDVAALFMGTRLTSQIRGVAMANLGLNTAQGMLETASDAIRTQLDIVQRMRELAVQAANGTLSDADRSNLDLEVQALYSEYNRITSQTSFNGTNLIDGSFGIRTLQAGASAGDRISLSFDKPPSSITMTITSVGSVTGDGTFQARTTYTVGNRSRDLEAVDLNGDGYQDLISPDRDDGTISVLLGNGNGTFKARTTYAVGGTVESVLSKDFNGDGKIDLVTADNGNSTVSILLGNGDGSFVARTTAATGNNPPFVASADLNGDGKFDLITADRPSATISILLGNGNGTFLPRTTGATGVNPQTLITGDFNGDSKIDVISVDNFDSTASIFLGNGNGTFGARTTVSTGSSPWSLASVDANGDGKLDFITDDSGVASIFLGNGNGTFAPRLTVTNSGIARSIATGDLNGDGKVDFVETTLSDVGIFFGNGNGTFATRTTLVSNYSVLIKDLNGDGALDIAAGADNSGGPISVYLANTTTPTTTTTSTISITTQSKAQSAITALDSVLTLLNTTQSQLGALHSRLDETISGNLLLSENLSAARSNALDADIAVETAELVRNQILQQAQVAVLGQANLQTQLSLKLLEDFTK